MKNFIDRIFELALLVTVCLLTGTALSAYFGEHLGGQTLLYHMIVSGVLVVGLPVFAVWWLFRMIRRDRSSGLQRFGFWTTVLFGLVTITTVFLCMLPLASTEQMEILIKWHGYAGLAMLAAVVVFCLGTRDTRRRESIRSDNPG